MSAVSTPRRVRGRDRALAEAGAVLLALGIAAFLTLHLATSTGRGEMMFLDADSMIVPLFVRSILEGTAQSWAMSPVLFVPESAVQLVLSLTGLDIRSLQVLTAIVNLMLVYGTLRLAASIAGRGDRAPMAAIAGYMTFGVLMLLEGDGDRNSLQLASLIAVPTYYAGTVLGTLLSVAITARVVRHRTPGLWPTAALGLIALVSTFTNPLYAAWCTLPVICATVLVTWRTRHVRSGVWIIATLAVGSFLGNASRGLASEWIAMNPGLYYQPNRWRDSIAYYWHLFVQRLESDGGATAAVITVTVLIVGGVLAVRTLREREAGQALLAVTAVLTPLATVVGFVVLGTEAARYLQPWTFAPPLAVLVLALRFRPTAAMRGAWTRFRVPLVATVAGVVMTVTVAPQLVAVAQRADVSLQCAVDWVNASGRTGAGQFWSMRAVKTHLQDPSQLLQTDPSLHPYAWLVDRGDFDTRTISFLLTDPQSWPFELPEPYQGLSSTTIDCGRYQIQDFGDAHIPIG